MVDGADAHLVALGDVGVSQPFGHEAEDLTLSRRQTDGMGSGPAGGPTRHPTYAGPPQFFCQASRRWFGSQPAVQVERRPQGGPITDFGQRRSLLERTREPVPAARSSSGFAA